MTVALALTALLRGPLAFDLSGVVVTAHVAFSVRVLRIDSINIASTTGNNVGTEILAPRSQSKQVFSQCADQSWLCFNRIWIL